MAWGQGGWKPVALSDACLVTPCTELGVGIAGALRMPFERLHGGPAWQTHPPTNQPDSDWNAQQAPHAGTAKGHNRGRQAPRSTRTRHPTCVHSGETEEAPPAGRRVRQLAPPSMHITGAPRPTRSPSTDQRAETRQGGGGRCTSAGSGRPGMSRPCLRLQAPCPNESPGSAPRPVDKPEEPSPDETTNSCRATFSPKVPFRQI